jgi:hypothetical protein
VIKLTVVITKAYDCCQLHTKFYPIFLSLGQLHMEMKSLGITNLDLHITDQRLMRFSISIKYWRKTRSTMVQYIGYLEISRKPLIQLGTKYYTVFSLSLEYPANYLG